MRGRARVIVVNTSYKACPWADVLLAVDCVWWDQYFHDANRRFRGELWTVAAEARDKYGLYWINGSNGAGLSVCEDVINVGRNTGYAAINLAYLFGARRIFLLGYDFQRTGGKNHWHADHPAPLKNLGAIENWRSVMRQMAVDLKRQGVPVVNCSRDTALTCFPRQTIEEAFP